MDASPPPLNSLSASFDAKNDLAPVHISSKSSPPDFSAAVSQWQSLLGDEHIDVSTKAVASHAKNAFGSGTRGSVILRPQNEQHVQQIVRISKQFEVPIYAVSTGRNWGYGAASPVIDGCAIIDLQEMRRIEMVDQELGIVSLQPGVTQEALSEFLSERGLAWMVPVHGGGPSCSLLGNALERGYGLTPTTDHFSALTSLRAILPDGSLYQSPFHASGASTIGSAHRWGIGPYLEGLFSQGNFGVVTEGTFTLCRRPEHVEAFFIRIKDNRQLGDIVDELRNVLSGLGASVAGVNFMNDRRVLSMSRDYPFDKVQPGGIISPEQCQKMAIDAGISAWTAAGVIHCPYRMRRPIRRELKRLLPDSVSRPIFMNRRRVKFARSISRSLPIGRGSILQQMESIEALLDLADGIPRKVALPLAYWLRDNSRSQEKELNPSQDGCGLIWYSPLVPMKAEAVIQFAEMVTQVCTDHQIEPLITLTSLSQRLFDATIPILYRPEIAGAKDRAHACFDALLEAGRQLGCLPYRVGTSTISRMIEFGDGTHWTLVNKLKQAIDPQDLMSPGRYCPTEKR